MFKIRDDLAQRVRLGKLSRAEVKDPKLEAGENSVNTQEDFEGTKPSNTSESKGAAHSKK